MDSRVRTPWLALLGLCACIERPWQDAPAKPLVDRTKLADVLLSAPPPELNPVGAVFGGAAELVGYKLEPPGLLPGRQARLTLVWRCRAELDAWHVFVHLDGYGDDISARLAQVSRLHEIAVDRGVALYRLDPSP